MATTPAVSVTSIDETPDNSKSFVSPPAAL
jgi:hypothetical protein